MTDKKNVLIGIDDFKKLRDLNGYYIDKSELIMGLIDKPNEVTLFSRPRRFGKKGSPSSTCSALRRSGASGRRGSGSTQGRSGGSPGR